MQETIETQEENIFNTLNQRKRELVQSGMDVIDLSIGTPDFAPDAHVMQALQNAAGCAENYKYSLRETDALIEAVQDWYKRRFAVQLAAEEIHAVAGSQEGIAHIVFALAEPGDVVLVPDPGYPIFSFGPQMAGAQVVPYPLFADKGWVLDFADIAPELAQQAKMMVVSYPNNPTTGVADAAFYQKLIAFAKQHDIMVIHDNAYADLMLDGTQGLSFLSFAGAKEVGIEFNSLSKTYNLTGMRCSFALGNADMLAKFRAFRSQIDYGMFYPIQAAAVAALNGAQDIVARNVAGYRERNSALCGGLREIGWNVPDSRGSMFVWAKIPQHYTSCEQFTLDLMEKTGVICVPGTSFGARGEGYVRFALVVPPARMREAVSRIQKSGVFNGATI